MAKAKITELKRRAIIAKQRLRMGYWQNLLQERDDLIELGGNTMQAKAVAEQIQRHKANRENLIQLEVDSAKEEETMYKKVSEMLSKDEDVCNPIGLLVDHEVYDSLDFMAKQKYILDLSRTYRRMRERYFLEKRKVAN